MTSTSTKNASSKKVDERKSPSQKSSRIIFIRDGRLIQKGTKKRPRARAG